MYLIQDAFNLYLPLSDVTTILRVYMASGEIAPITAAEPTPGDIAAVCAHKHIHRVAALHSLLERMFFKSNRLRFLVSNKDHIF